MTSEFARYPDGLRWIPVINTESVAIPPFAMMEVKGGYSQNRIRVGKPSADSALTGIMVNGPGTIPATTGGGDGVGQGLYANTQVIAAYDSSAEGTDPAGGETWGVKAGSWFLWGDQTGFMIAKNAIEDSGICDIIPDPDAAPAGGSDNFIDVVTCVSLVVS